MWDLNFSDLNFSDLNMWDLNFSDLNILDLNFLDLGSWILNLKLYHPRKFSDSVLFESSPLPLLM